MNTTSGPIGRTTTISGRTKRCAWSATAASTAAPTKAASDPGGVVASDAKIPSNYEPFGIQNVNGLIYVTYAPKSIYEGQTPEGSGYIDVFLPDGSLDHRLVKRGTLNSPWGVARIPGGFGKFKRDIAVGNFGDGRIQVFDPLTGEFRGFFRKAKNGKPVVIDGLWGLAFGNDGPAGSSTDLFFTAGPHDEADGLFGKISISQATTTSSNPGDPGYVYPMSASAVQLFGQSSDHAGNLLAIV